MNKKSSYTTAMTLLCFIAVVLLKTVILDCNSPDKNDRKLKILRTHYDGYVVENIWDEYKQSDSNTCGAACLAFLLSQTGFNVSEDDVYKFLDSIPKEISFSNMEEYVQSIGLNYQSLNVPADYFKKSPTSAIMHFKTNHFVVFVREISDKDVIIFDPAYGFVYLTWDKLLDNFDEKLFYIYKK